MKLKYDEHGIPDTGIKGLKLMHPPIPGIILYYYYYYY